jgi:hypothetical protein
MISATQILENIQRKILAPTVRKRAICRIGVPRQSACQERE